MFNHRKCSCSFARVWLLALLCAASLVIADARADDAAVLPAQPIERGQRVLSAGHSFHFFMPKILEDLAQSAGIVDHVQVDLQAIGGSRTIQHWNVPDDKNKIKRALVAGNVDVLTLSPIFLPDEGVEKFVRMAVEHNPNIRVTLQVSWMPYDFYNPQEPLKGRPVDREVATGDSLRKVHAEVFQSYVDLAQSLNKDLGKPVVFIAPCGQAVIGLRERIVAGKVDGIRQQKELFVDDLGHGSQPLQTLVAYVHFAVIYRRSPVGLPVPKILAQAKNPNWDEKLNRVLQEAAWQAVVEHPLSGVRAVPTD